ncbi:MAG: DUF2007 domain-containing protein [candidate division WOR-3 bacterium]|nr:DUF2007 domain-containing protein [candidate division WOR-3 bacterium]
MMALKTVFKPENELIAMTIKSLLEESGIKAIIHSFQIPWYDGLAKMMRPEWGEILVDEDDFNEATEIITNFLKSENQ